MIVSPKWQGQLLKVCKDCGDSLPVAAFFWKKSTENEYYYPSSNCKRCNQKSRSSYLKNRRSTDEEYRTREIAKSKGITSDQYNHQLAAQDNTCAVCGAVGGLELDHDHSCCASSGRTCGKCNRGFLCKRCNRMLGMAMDDPELLVKAQTYLLAGGVWERFTEN